MTNTASSESLSPERLEAVATGFRDGESFYRDRGSMLYAALCAGAWRDPTVVALASQAQEGANPAYQLFSSVRYLLLRDPVDPLSRYFPTAADGPSAAPDQVMPDFVRFCAERRDELAQLIASRTVQATYVDRCKNLMPALSYVADAAGEPLNLIEIGCSAGVLLTFDKYAYDLQGRGRIGPKDAPLTLPTNVDGGPTLRVPRIGSRIGLDLRPVDVRLEDERRWLMAQTWPHFREERARLATALEVVQKTDIRMLQGDALKLLPGVLAETPSPLCIFHSACLAYWSAQSKAALDALLSEAGRSRDIYRVSIESREFAINAWVSRRNDGPAEPDRFVKTEGEVTVIRYRGGSLESRVVAYVPWEYYLREGVAFHWLD